MKKVKMFALLLSLMMTLSLLAGCGSSDDPAGDKTDVPADTTQQTTQETKPENTSITVVDMMGREVTLPEVPTRVVALTADGCEILCALGAGGTLVGRGEYCDYPAQVLEIPAVSSGSETNLEQIIALQPQLVIMGTMDQPKEQVDQLEAAGITVVVSHADDGGGQIDATYEAITLIGALMGRQDEAAEIIAEMMAAFEALRAKTAGLEGKSVYFEVSPLQYGLWAAGQGTFMNEIAEILGLENIFADVSGWAEVSEEQVIERDPDYIVTISMYFGDGPTPEEEILSRSGWENMTAIKNNAILNLQNNELSRPTPRLVEGAQMMFDFVYGNDE